MKAYGAEKGWIARGAISIANLSLADLSDFKKIQAPDNLIWPAFSSVKGDKLPESVKKLKENRKEKRETTNTNAYAAHFKHAKEQHRKYVAKWKIPTPLATVLSISQTRATGLLAHPCRLGRQKRGLYDHTADGILQKNYARTALIVGYNVRDFFFWQNSCIAHQQWGISIPTPRTKISDEIISSS